MILDTSDLSPTARKRMEELLATAAEDYQKERFLAVKKSLKEVQKKVPTSVEVLELLGLTYYRLGEWENAIEQLESFRKHSGSFDQHPVLADCCRALKQWKKAETLWLDLGAASPEPELVEEGRIVQAGVLADQGKLAAAIKFLEKAPKPKNPKVRHLRRWYALADLYERSGDNARARRLFAQISSVDATFGDAVERSASLN